MESILSELIAAIIFSALGLVFARPIAAVLRRRFYQRYLLPPESVPSIIVHDETPVGSNGERMIVIQNNGNIALSDFRFYKCCFSFGAKPSLLIEPLNCEVEYFALDSERGGLADIRGLSIDSLQFNGCDSWEKRLFVEMSDVEGHIFRLTNYLSDKGMVSSQGLHLAKRHLPRRRIKKLSKKEIDKFCNRYSLDMTTG